MSKLTAQILVGTNSSQTHEFWPTHALYLLEGQLVEWVLVPFSLDSSRTISPISTIVWLPSEDSVFEDALLMVGLYVEHLQLLTGVTETFCPEHPIDLKTDLKPEQLKALRQINRNCEHPTHVKLTVFSETAFWEQYPIVKQYHWDLEMCYWWHVKMAPGAVKNDFEIC